METSWTLDHFSFELVVQVFSILISVGIGWFIWEKQFKVTKNDATEQKNIDDDKRLQTFLMQCLLMASDNKSVLNEALRFQIYSAAPYEIKSWLAGLQFGLKIDAISNLLNSGLDQKLPSNVQAILTDSRLKIFEIQKNLASSEKKFEFYSANKTFETNAHSDWDNLKRDFEECIKKLEELEGTFVKKDGLVIVKN